MENGLRNRNFSTEMRSHFCTFYSHFFHIFKTHFFRMFFQSHFQNALFHICSQKCEKHAEKMRFENALGKKNVKKMRFENALGKKCE